jgi:predicted GNAT family N-acyltransferase
VSGHGPSAARPAQRYEVRPVRDLSDLEACFAVRKEVFVREQGIPEDVEYDGHDADALHVLAVAEDGVPLGTGRLLHGPGVLDRTGGDLSVGSLGRLAVACRARGLGIGTALVRAVEEAAREAGLAHVDLHAQSHALGFYERLGYRAYGEEFPDAGIPHRSMRRAL